MGAAALFAAVGTQISYPCAPLPGSPASGCASFQKAILHPADLAHNVQGSLTQLIVNFLIAFALVASLLLLIAFAGTRRRSSYLH